MDVHTWTGPVPWTGEHPRLYPATPPVDIVRLAELGQRMETENPHLSVSALSDRITIECVDHLEPGMSTALSQTF